MAKDGKPKGTNKKGSISFKNSIRTRLIAVMLIVAIVPLAIAVIVSYSTSTKKAKLDSIDSLDWQAWYIESEF